MADFETPTPLLLKWSSEHPLYLESQVKMAESGCSFIPYRVTQLRVAIKTDMKRILSKISQYAANDTCMEWLTDGNEPGKIHSRIATALEYVLSDSEPDEDDDVSLSYEYGYELILDLAIKKTEATKETDNAIHSCMIALIARGQVQQAFNLARFAGALKSVNPQSGVFKIAKAIPMTKNGIPKQFDDGLQHMKAISREINQYKILTTLQRFIDNNE